MNLFEMPPNVDPKLDDALKETFRRQEPAEGFADRVLARIPPAGIPQKRSVPAWRREWLAIAASACFAVVGAGAWQHHERQVEGEKAKQQLIYALTVASQSLQMTKQMVER